MPVVTGGDYQAFRGPIFLFVFLLLRFTLLLLRDKFQFGSADCSFAAEDNLCTDLPCEVCGAGEVHMDSIAALIMIGFLSRVAAFFALVFTNRHKQV